MKIRSSLLFFLLGFLSLAVSTLLVWQRNNPQRLSFTINNPPSQQTTSNLGIYPTELSIKALEIRLPIQRSKIEKEKWQATTKGISYLASSPIPGNKGNSIIYGHNWPNLLGPLIQIKPNQKITITFSDGSQKIFSVYTTQVVNPTQSEILSDTEDTRVTIYTCTGFMDSKRFVVVSLPVS